jgi:hypothetical protein
MILLKLLFSFSVGFYFSFKFNSAFQVSKYVLFSYCEEVSTVHKVLSA